MSPRRVTSTFPDQKKGGGYARGKRGGVCSFKFAAETAEVTQRGKNRMAGRRGLRICMKL